MFPDSAGGHWGGSSAPSNNPNNHPQLQGRMAQDMTEKELLKMELDQLKKEVKNERQMVSKTGKEIKEYIESMAGEDPLLKGVPEDKNPFKEKGGCTIS
ncbi:guanine nucleotide-binding protein G(I)/G(S)/G(O) subunit gamma-T2 isoform 1-T1 [Acridotheres tristis]